MLRQRLDFSRPQPAVTLNGRFYGGGVLAAGIVLAVVLVMHQQGLLEDIDTTETQVKRLARAGATGRQDRASREAMAEEIRRVNQAATRLTIPWENLFKTVEGAADKSVALLSLQPNFQKRELKISGEADDFAAIMRYVERLEGGGALSDVRLVSHEVVARPGAAQLRFELTAAWKAQT